MLQSVVVFTTDAMFCIIIIVLQGFELAHNGSVNDAVFAPSEGRIATAGGDALVKV